MALMKDNIMKNNKKSKPVNKRAKKKMTFRRFKRLFFPFTPLQNIFLVPAVSFIALGTMLFIFPELLQYAFAIIFVYTGVTLIYLSVLAVTIKRSADRLIKKFKGGMFVQGSPLILSEEEFQEALEEHATSKKTIYH